MAKTFQDKLKARQKAKFIGRNEHMTLFKNNLEASEPCSIINIYGQGGVGKTYLSRQYENFAKENNCLTAYSDEDTKSVLQWMDLISNQFKSQDAELSDFDKSYKTYQQETKKLEADPDKPKGTLGNAVRAFTKGAIKEAKKIPGAELIASFIDDDGLANSFGDWADFARKKIGNKDEVELVLEPLKVLTPLFWKGINKYANTKKFVCFFIDTFEETDSVLETWLLECLNEKYGDIPYNILLIIAGREPLNPNLWSSFSGLTETIPLEPFTEPEAAAFFLAQGITDEAIKADISHLSNRLPVLMAWLATAAKESKGNIQDACETAVERFLKWVVDEKQRNIALAAALPRKLNQDIIESFLEDKTQAEAYFNWLIAQPFVSKRGDAWAYHNVVREQMLRFVRNRSHREWGTKHEALSAYYLQLQQALDIAETEQYLHADWLAFEQERLYHALCAKPDKHIALAINGLVNQWSLSDFETAALFGETLYEAGKAAEHKVTEGWGLRIITAMETFNIEDFALFDALVEDILVKDFVINANSLAYLNYSNGISYGNKENFEQEIKTYKKAIEIKPDFHEALNNMGIAYSNLKKYEEAINCYKKAIEIKPNNDKAFYNMGIAYSNLERYEQAIEYYGKAIEIKPDNYQAFHNMGIAYGNLEKYEKAIECFEKATEVKPDFHQAFNNMGSAYDGLEKYEKAIECFKKAIELAPDNKDYHSNYGFALLCFGKIDQAENMLQKAIDLGNLNIGNMNLGHVYLTQQKEAEAMSCYLKSLAAFEDKDIFWKGMKDDFQYLVQYGITEAQYEKVLADIKRES